MCVLPRASVIFTLYSVNFHLWKKQNNSNKKKNKYFYLNNKQVILHTITYTSINKLNKNSCSVGALNSMITVCTLRLETNLIFIA